MQKIATLKEYRRKRDFNKSTEPSGKKERGKKARNPIFVIQKHDASRLHYDFRLEVDGVLKSWALPKGPSRDPREKRLAAHVEDHPLDYATFEGIIPEGQYGAGKVIVWDSGTYRNIKKDNEGHPLSMKRALELGRAEVWLEGKKIRGGYALIQTKMRGQSKNWLLVKKKDKASRAGYEPTKSEPKSVLSGRGIEEIGDEEEP
jgi:DNA ligase D-like protein (predicted 3'-phosphoesterase)